MAKKIHPRDLTEKELRYLMREKRLATRQKRLAEFQRNGRLVRLEPTVFNQPDQQISVEEQLDLERKFQPSAKKKLILMFSCLSSKQLL